MTAINPASTLARLATSRPASIAVLHRHGLDYCCKGKRTLVQACEGTLLNVAQLIAEVGCHDAHDRLPAPPFPGIPGTIEPLRSVGDLHEEGRSQRNCVRSYVRDAVAGELALYRVLRPERATLSIERCESGWHLGQLLAVGNSEPREETVDEIGRWLALWGISWGSAPSPPWEDGEPMGEGFDQGFAGGFAGGFAVGEDDPF